MIVKWVVKEFCFGASQFPKIAIPDEELEKFEILWKMFAIEMVSKDDLQNGYK
jgi:hypothetical protein